MEIVYKFSPSEVMKDFCLISETYRLGSKPTETGRGKRLYKQMIDPENEEMARELIEKARYAHAHGLKNDVELTSKQILVLKQLVNYCMTL